MFDFKVLAIRSVILDLGWLWTMMTMMMMIVVVAVIVVVQMMWVWMGNGMMLVVVMVPGTSRTHDLFHLGRGHQLPRRSNRGVAISTIPVRGSHVCFEVRR